MRFVGKRWLLAFFVLVTCLMGCESGERSDAERDDFYRYQKTVSSTVPLLREATESMLRIERQEVSVREAVRLLRQEIAPRYEKVVSYMDGNAPKTPEVKKGYYNMVAYYRGYASLVRDLADGMAKNDPSKLDGFEGRRERLNSQMARSKEIQANLNRKYGFADLKPQDLDTLTLDSP